MSRLMKLAAVLLMLVAVILVFLAIRSGSAPAPTPVIAPTPTPAPQQALPQSPVVLAKHDLKAGTVLSAEDLALAYWPAVPEHTFAEASLLPGQVLRFDLKKAQPVLQSFLAQGLATHLQEGERAVTVAIDTISGAGQRIQPGDWVDVFFMFNNSAEVERTQARLLLPKVRVLAYGRQSVSGEQADEDGAASRKPEPARHAMLAVPLEQVNAVLLAARSGNLQFVLRSPEDVLMPDEDLFPSFAAIVPPRSGLNEAQRLQLQTPENRAWAGLSLSELAWSQAPQPEEEAVAAAVSRENRAGPGRVVEIIRGNRKESVAY